MRDKEEGQIVFTLHTLFQQFSGTVPPPFPELETPHEKLSFGCSSLELLYSEASLHKKKGRLEERTKNESLFRPCQKKIFCINFIHLSFEEERVT